MPGTGGHLGTQRCSGQYRHEPYRSKGGDKTKIDKYAEWLQLIQNVMKERNKGLRWRLTEGAPLGRTLTDGGRELTNTRSTKMSYGSTGEEKDIIKRAAFARYKAWNTAR